MNDYELSGEIATQEYDIGDYWEQFDDNSRLILTPEENNNQISDEELVQTMEEIAAKELISLKEYLSPEPEPEYLAPDLNETKKIVKVMYGCNKTEAMKTEEDLFIESKIDVIFRHMQEDRLFRESKLNYPNIKK